MRACLLQSLDHGEERASLLADLAKAAEEYPRLAVTLASGRLLSLLLEAAAKLAAAHNSEQQVGCTAGVVGCMQAPRRRWAWVYWAVAQPQSPTPLLQALETLASWDAGIRGLANAASAAIDSAPQTGLPGGLAAQLKQGAHSLRLLREALSGLAADASATQRTALLRQLAQPAAELAGLVQQCQDLPTVEEERRLAVARAAAARSCAYLRCANVAGQGGPAAGEGEGSSRCR